MYMYFLYNYKISIFLEIKSLLVLISISMDTYYSKYYIKNCFYQFQISFRFKKFELTENEIINKIS